MKGCKAVATPSLPHEEVAMFNQMGPMEIGCDAPAYGIVRSCRDLGFQTPEDVRWCRLSHLPNLGDLRSDPATLLSWSIGWGLSKQRQPTCSCRQELPKLTKYVFQF